MRETPVMREERAVEIRPTITKQRPVLSGTPTRLKIEGMHEHGFRCGHLRAGDRHIPDRSGCVKGHVEVLSDNDAAAGSCCVMQ